MHRDKHSPASAFVEALGPHAHCHTPKPDRPPLFIEPKGEELLDRGRFRAWTRQVMPALEGLIWAHGGIVLRGFPLEQTADFADLIDQLPPFEEGYIGGRAPRMQIAGRVLEVTRLDASIGIGTHTEMAYRQYYPKRIAFFSRRTAPVGGETIIADARGFADAMGEALVARISALGIRSVLNYGPRADAVEAAYVDQDAYAWNHAFHTDDPKEVDVLCAQRGMEPLWHDDGSLSVFAVLEPFVTHPILGRRIYRSGLHRAHTAIEALPPQPQKNKRYMTGMYLANGERLDASEVARINAIIDDSTYSWPWRDGDTMILDNLQVWHGRNPYQGTRDVQVALFG